MPGPGALSLGQESESPGGRVNTKPSAFLIQQVWGETWKFSCLASSQVTLLLVGGLVKTK